MLFEPLNDVLIDPSRPTFLFGSTPPREGTTEEKAQETCAKFTARSAVLATDGYIVYDIQDECSRTNIERPFPFRKTMEPALYGSFFKNQSGKDCVVYKSIVEESVEGFQSWLNQAVDVHGHHSFTLVGAPSSSMTYQGPTMQQAAALIQAKEGCAFGCVCIPERHTSKGNEHLNMLRKIEFGAQWFITQGIFTAAPVIRLLNEYGAECRSRGILPKKVILTFAPCGRPKTMTFIKWLGMNVPEETETRMMNATSPIRESALVLQEILLEILEATKDSGVPLGLNVESLSIFKEEIDMAHELFQTLQAILLNSRGSPWSVKWFCVKRSLSIEAQLANQLSSISSSSLSPSSSSSDLGLTLESSNPPISPPPPPSTFTIASSPASLLEEIHRLEQLLSEKEKELSELKA